MKESSKSIDRYREKKSLPRIDISFFQFTFKLAIYIKMTQIQMNEYFTLNATLCKASKIIAFQFKYSIRSSEIFNN